MLFNSFEFLLFLPIVFLFYWYVLGKNRRLQNVFVVLASYLFYGWWDGRFLVLIGFTSLLSWLSGVVIDRLRDGRTMVMDTRAVRWKCRWITGGNIVLNLVILGFFKYYNFFVDSFIAAFSFLGLSLHASTLSIILPVGISFYTFQALSYTIDVYRRKLVPTHDIVAFFAFVSFFPQLVAGPIERATHLLVQFYVPRTFLYDSAVDGMRQILCGLFKKMVIADNCAVVVNDIFGNYMNYSPSTLMLGAVLFSFQIYGDFSGYSDIAVGVAKLFGITLKQNFHYPYFSSNMIDFWRRWHISLNTWFLDYVYIPLGGNREGMYKHLRNIAIIFFLSGLWHGANWTFVVWGCYHALLFIFLVLIKTKRAEGIPAFRRLPSMLLTFVFVTIGWIIFRAETISDAFLYMHRMLSTCAFDVPRVGGANNVVAIVSIFYIGILLLGEWANRSQSFGLDLRDVSFWWVRYSVYALLIASIYFLSGDSSTFIYFQF